MSNDLKVKVLMVAAVEANTAAEAQERLAELQHNAHNDPPEKYREKALRLRLRARILLNRAAELAEFSESDMRLIVGAPEL